MFMFCCFINFYTYYTFVCNVLQEREKLKEEKKKYAERLKLWSRPREDMECSDLKVNMPTYTIKHIFV